jgi:hypothetical protein
MEQGVDEMKLYHNSRLVIADAKDWLDGITRFAITVAIPGSYVGKSSPEQCRQTYTMDGSKWWVEKCGDGYRINQQKI